MNNFLEAEDIFALSRCRFKDQPVPSSRSSKKGGEWHSSLVTPLFPDSDTLRGGGRWTPWSPCWRWTGPWGTPSSWYSGRPSSQEASRLDRSHPLPSLFWRRSRSKRWVCCRLEWVGCIHCSRRSRSKRWVCCRLEWVGRILCSRRSRSKRWVCCRLEWVGCIHCSRRSRSKRWMCCRLEWVGCIHCTFKI